MKTVSFFFCCAALYAADTIVVSEGRPLSKLALELTQRYGYLVTYEEAPYDSTALRTVLIVFHVPDASQVQALAAANLRIPFGLPDVLMPLLKEYSQSGNPGKFAVMFEGGYAHIVPTARVVGGKLEEFAPVLNTTVTLTSRGHSCNEALDALFNQIATVRGVCVVKAMVPVGALLRHECSIVANTIPAREVLKGILEQLGATPGHAGPNNRFTWALLYDLNTDRYFLSTILVPDR
jgi:hypothetical protein